VYVFFFGREIGSSLKSCLLVPPHGAGQITELQSIFEKSHLRENALFLDIQCWNDFLIHLLIY